MTGTAAAPLVLRSNGGNDNENASGIVTLTLNRGARFNPLSAAMIASVVH